MLIDPGKLTQAQVFTFIKDQTAECAQTYKYLGTTIDSKLTSKANCEALYKKENQHLHCLRTLLTLFYRAFIESVLCFSMVASWFSICISKIRIG